MILNLVEINAKRRAPLSEISVMLPCIWLFNQNIQGIFQGCPYMKTIAKIQPKLNTYHAYTVSHKDVCKNCEVQ